MTDDTLAATPYSRSEAGLAPPLRDQPLDIRQVMAVIVRRAPLIAVIMIAVFALALAALFTSTPTYTATSQVVIEGRAQRVIDIQRDRLSGLQCREQLCQQVTVFLLDRDCILPTTGRAPGCGVDDNEHKVLAHGVCRT